MNNLKLKFEQIFYSYMKFPKEVLDGLFSLLSIVNIEKGTDIVTLGKPNTKDYFLLNGILREYSFDDEANDVTLNFFNGEAIITPNFCRTYNDISILSIQALSTCTIGIIEASEIERLRTENIDFANGSAMMITKLFKDKLQHQISHATLTGINKLALFRNEFPGLENYVPHPYIASYLGITNVSLSRLRKQK
jgi:hypothetical protein